MTNQIESLRAIQEVEVNNNFANGELWNDIETIIYGLEHPNSKLETIQGDIYGARTMDEIMESRRKRNKIK